MIKWIQQIFGILYKKGGKIVNKIVKIGVCFAMVFTMAPGMLYTVPAEETSKAVYASGIGAGTSSGKVTLDKASAKLAVGKTLTLKAAVSGSSSAKFTWSSSNPKVASVDSSGKVKAVGKGIAVITVKASNGKTAVCTVTVVTAEEAYIEEVIRLVNEERTKAGLKKLTVGSAVTKASAKRAKEITSKYSHTRPDGRAWHTVLNEYKVSYTAAVENIAYHCETPKAVVDAWMKSPNHRKNILNPKYRAMGISLCKKNNTTYWAQIFTA